MSQRERERSDEETGSFEMRRSFRLLVGFDTLSNCVANTKQLGEKKILTFKQMVAVSAVFEESAEGEHPRRKGETGRTDNDEDFFASPPPSSSSSSSSSLNTLSSSSGKRKDGISSSSGKSSASASLKSETEEEEEEEEKDDDDENDVSSLLERLALGDEKRDGEEKNYTNASFSSLASRQPVGGNALKTKDLRGVAEYVNSDACKNIVVMCGAGISVSAGIPDFRTPGTGLYDNLAAYDLPYPQAVFEIGFFKSNPEPFYVLASHLQPGKFEPTKTHKFIKLLETKKKLRRVFTQNIDSLETKAGVSEEKVVAAHGNFDTARCLRGHAQDVKKVMEHVARGAPMRCEECEEYVKPDIVFFGENLPVRFGKLAKVDFNRENCDLLIVMGTSLQVQPFAGLIEYPDIDCPRILINREKVGEVPSRRGFFERGTSKGRGFDFSEEGKRDVLFLGDCDEGVRQLCEHLEWELE